MRLVGGIVVLLAGAPVVLIFTLIAADGPPMNESRCTVASCDAGADRDLPRAPSPTSQN